MSGWSPENLMPSSAGQGQSNGLGRRPRPAQASMDRPDSSGPLNLEIDQIDLLGQCFSPMFPIATVHWCDSMIQLHKGSSSPQNEMMFLYV